MQNSIDLCKGFKSFEIILNCQQLSTISGATPIGSAVAHPIKQNSETELRNKNSAQSVEAYSTQIEAYSTWLLSLMQNHTRKFPELRPPQITSDAARIVQR